MNGILSFLMLDKFEGKQSRNLVIL